MLTNDIVSFEQRALKHFDHNVGLMSSSFNILGIGTDRSEQTVQTQEQSDLGLHCLPIHCLFWMYYHIYLAIKRAFPLFKMATNNLFSPMNFCYQTSFTLPKQSQKSRSIL